MGAVKRQMETAIEEWWSDATKIMAQGWETSNEYVHAVFKELGNFPDPQQDEEEIEEQLKEGWENLQKGEW